MNSWHSLINHLGIIRQPYLAAITLIDLIVLVGLQINVIRARIQHKVDAPNTDGPVPFRRAYRLHVNMVEQLVLHLPLLWLASIVIGDMRAAFIGLLWLAARALYINDYRRDPKTRAAGFAIGLVINLILIIIVAAGIIRSYA